MPPACVARSTTGVAQGRISEWAAARFLGPDFSDFLLKWVNKTICSCCGSDAEVVVDEVVVVVDCFAAVFLAVSALLRVPCCAVPCYGEFVLTIMSFAARRTVVGVGCV